MEAYGALVLRVTLGAVFLAHAYAQLYLIGPHQMARYFVQAGLPFPLLGAWYVILAHGIGGLFLLLGVLARWAALANIPVMAGAVFAVHWKQGFFMDADGGWELAFVVLMATIAQALLGPGAFTLKR
jgi:putative oxidoreductase